MSQRKIYEVVPEGEGWAAKERGISEPIARADSKDEVVHKVRAIAREHEPAQVILKGRNGRIQQEWTYGQDPPESPG
jgi:uncharacterized protein DUF2188